MLPAVSRDAQASQSKARDVVKPTTMWAAKGKPLHAPECPRQNATRFSGGDL